MPGDEETLKIYVTGLDYLVLSSVERAKASSRIAAIDACCPLLHGVFLRHV